MHEALAVWCLVQGNPVLQLSGIQYNCWFKKQRKDSKQMGKREPAVFGTIILCISMLCVDKT